MRKHGFDLVTVEQFVDIRDKYAFVSSCRANTVMQQLNDEISEYSYHTPSLRIIITKTIDGKNECFCFNKAYKFETKQSIRSLTEL